MGARSILLPILAAAAALAAAAPAPAQTRSALGSPAKLLVVDLDDVGFDLLRESPTPTLDFLEQNGRFFDNFTTSPICSPTRAMFMAGAFSSHPDLLLGQVIHGPTVNAFTFPIAPLVPLPRLLSDAGLSTVKVGKWHLAPNIRPTHPLLVGFDAYAGVNANVQQAGEDFFNYPKNLNGTVTLVSGQYLTTDETDDAIRAVSAGTDFVSLSYHAAHAPWHEPPAHLHSVSPLLTDRDRARAMLQACDTELGRLLNVALPLGYTVLVFSDNGTPQPIGGLKGTMREGGVINPLWAYGPGIVPGLDHSLVSVTDLYATIANFFGIAAGVGSNQPLRGPNSRSFIVALRGGAVDYRWTWTERFRQLGVNPRGNPNTRWRRMIRGRRYKLVWDDEVAGERRLVDLELDPLETTNLLQDPAGLTPAADFAHRVFRYVMDRFERQ